MTRYFFISFFPLLNYTFAYSNVLLIKLKANVENGLFYCYLQSEKGFFMRFALILFLFVWSYLLAAAVPVDTKIPIYDESHEACEFFGHKDGALFCSFSHDGSLLLSADSSAVYVWSICDDTLLLELECDLAPSGGAFIGDDHILIYDFVDGVECGPAIWNWKEGSLFGFLHKDYSSLHVLPDGQGIFQVMIDRAVVLRLEEGAIVAKKEFKFIDLWKESGVCGVSVEGVFSIDGRNVIVWNCYRLETSTKFVVLIDLGDGRELFRCCGEEPESRVQSFSLIVMGVIPEKNTILLSPVPWRYTAYDIGTGRMCYTIDTKLCRDVSACSYFHPEVIPGGELIVSFFREDSDELTGVRIVSLDGSKKVSLIHESAGACFSASSGGNLLAVATAEGVCLWDLRKIPELRS